MYAGRAVAVTVTDADAVVRFADASPSPTRARSPTPLTRLSLCARCAESPRAADPVVVVFRGDTIFSVQVGGYWHSPDMVDWKLVVPTGLPIEAYAPAVMVFAARSLTRR